MLFQMLKQTKNQLLHPLTTRTISNSLVVLSNPTKTNPSNEEVGRSLTDFCQKDGVRIITLNEPKKCNPLSMAMMDSINSSLIENYENKELRCIIINANGPIWSAGHDLKELAASTPNQQSAIFNKLTEIIVNIRKLPVPVIARVNGLAAAAGCQLVSSCDMVVASDKSKFSTPGAKFGVFCSTPGVALARSMNSRSKAAYMLMTSLPISAQEAYEAGLVTRLVTESELDQEIDRITTAIKMQSRAVIALGKEFFYKQISMQNINDAYTAGSETMVKNLQSPDGQEGLNSFSQKRKPEWKHE